MSGQAGTVLRTEWFVLELRRGVRVNVAVLEGSAPEEYFAVANQPYERWAAASVGPLDELLRELRTQGGLPLVPIALAGETEGGARRVHLGIDGFFLEEVSLLLALQRPLEAREQETLLSGVRDILTAIDPIARRPGSPGANPPVLPSSPLPTPQGLLARLKKTPPSAPRLTLDARPLPGVLPANELGEVRFTLRLRNEGDSPAWLYPEAAQLAIRSGWAGPGWTLRAITAGYRPERTRLQELRLWHGPPGMPPDGRAFASARRTLLPGESVERRLVACWVPRARLGGGRMSLPVLDPEGMDGLGDWPFLDSSAILVLERSRAEVEQALVRRADFPRGEVVLFTPERGLIQWTWGYQQQPWAGFVPEQSWALDAPPCTVLVQ